MYARSADAKAHGWFSRRHETDAAHKAAKLSREAHKDDKMVRAQMQNEKTIARKAEEKAAK